MDTQTAERFRQAIRTDGRYPPAAYEFLHRGLQYTTEMIYGEEVPDGPHHVTGRQLCDGLRRLAVETWGPLAPTVLHSWNIRDSRDFGEMVFLLVDLKLMGKQDDDHVEDFEGAFEVDDTFADYEISLDHFDKRK